MKVPELNTIDDVLDSLDEIILLSVTENDTSGYFAALYRQVTSEVKQGILNNYFDDGARMELLDVIFAKKYIDAWHAWQNCENVSQSWKEAFRFSKKQTPVVLQHLLTGMNAHINLDLGIAAAEISRNSNISLLKNDFFKINHILSMQVNHVQNNLSAIWPLLKKILAKTGKLDNLLVDFSMELARDGAWEFAHELSGKPIENWEAFIKDRDSVVAAKSQIVTNPKIWIKILLWIIRLGERGTVSEKINYLKKENHAPFKPV
ncbi:MAG: DUF5995 family protein [Tangfeifania sp.]